ncbi:MAG: TSUP family transporter [Planctomycetota bacterium]
MTDLGPRTPRWVSACGVLSGLVSGLLGVGGGLVVSPMLLLAGLPLRRATGTALAVIPTVALMAVVADLITLPGNLHPGLALVIAAGGPIGIQLGRAIDRRLAVHTLKRLFQLLLLITACRSLGIFGALPDAALPGLFPDNAVASYLLAGALGTAAGVCAILFGVGGGIVVVPGLLLLVGGVDFRAATAASLLAMVPTTLLSLRVALRDNRVERSYLRGLMLGAVPAAALAVALRNLWLQPPMLSILFGSFLLFTVVKMMLNRSDAGDSDPR